jgi:hypothetical protein
MLYLTRGEHANHYTTDAVSVEKGSKDMYKVLNKSKITSWTEMKKKEDGFEGPLQNKK